MGQTRRPCRPLARPILGSLHIPNVNGHRARRRTEEYRCHLRVHRAVRYGSAAVPDLGELPDRGDRSQGEGETEWVLPALGLCGAGTFPGPPHRVSKMFADRGQTSGTAIITKIYNTYGWTPTGATCVAFVGAAMLVLLVRYAFFATVHRIMLIFHDRGPHEVRWIGWRGGSQLLKREKLTDLSPQAITERVRDKKEKVVAAVVGGDEAERGGAGEGFLEHAEMPGAESGRRD